MSSANLQNRMRLWKTCQARLDELNTICHDTRMTIEQVRELIRSYLKDESLDELAKRIGVTRQHIWAVLNGANLGERLLKGLGLQTEVRIRPRKMTAKHRKIYLRAGQRAQQIICRAIKDGQLPNLKTETIMCVDCKVRPAKHYEHRDYAKPLEVAPVCQGCNLKRGPAKIGGPIPNYKGLTNRARLKLKQITEK